jgi:hypothetical protein
MVDVKARADVIRFALAANPEFGTPTQIDLRRFAANHLIETAMFDTARKLLAAHDHEGETLPSVVFIRFFRSHFLGWSLRQPLPSSRRIGRI